MVLREGLGLEGLLDGFSGLYVVLWDGWMMGIWERAGWGCWFSDEGVDPPSPVESSPVRRRRKDLRSLSRPPSNSKPDLRA